MLFQFCTFIGAVLFFSFQLLKSYGPPCPVYDELEAKTKDNPEYRALEAKYKVRQCCVVTVVS